jgi:succinoglycan biosynthesis transport protein ExoP
VEVSDNLPPQQSLKDYLAIVLRRKWVVIGTLVAVTATGIIATSLSTPVFRSSATLLVDATDKQNQARAWNSGADLQALAQPQGVALQLAVLKSRPFLARVWQKLAVPRGAKIGAMTAESGDDPGLIRLTVESTDARLAARAANTMAEEYLAYLWETYANALHRVMQLGEAERLRAQRELARAEEKLLVFRQQHGVADFIGERGSRASELVTLEKNQLEVQNSIVRVAAQLGELQVELAQEPAMTRTLVERPNPRRDAIQGKLADLETQRVALLAEYREGAPQLTRLDAQIARIKQRLAVEPETILLRQRVANPAVAQLRTRGNELHHELRGLEAEGRQRLLQLAMTRQRANQLSSLEAELGELTGARAIAMNALVAAGQRLQEIAASDRARPSTARIFERAGVPSRPFKPNKRANAVMAAVLGMILGLAIGFLLESLDDRFTTPQQVERELGLPIMGYLPLISSRNSLLMSTMPARSRAAESYRALRTSISFAAMDGPLRTIVVSSSDQSEGKSLTAINLAIAMAMEGRRVLVVDADLRRPKIHRLIGSDMSPGLTDVLLGTSELSATLRPFPGVPGLQVMTCGEMPPNPAELLNSAQMAELVGYLAKAVDVAIFDCPPVLPVTDATLLSAKVDGVLLVAAVGKARRAGLNYTKEQLVRARARLVGLVFNKVNGNLGSRYPYYDRSYYEEDRRRRGIGLPNGRANNRGLVERTRVLLGRNGKMDEP